MRTVIFTVSVVLVVGASLGAQERKPVPKDSARISIPGCTRGYVFTAVGRTADEPGNVSVPDGTHFRLNGPKKLISEIRLHEGSMIELTGLTKKGQFLPGGIAIGGGARVGQGSGVGGGMGGGQLSIDVESWRQINGSCPTH